MRAEPGDLTEASIDRRRADFGREVAVVTVQEAGHHLLLDQPLAMLAVIRTAAALWDGLSGRGSEEPVAR